jgi:hypothetical protein
MSRISQVIPFARSQCLIKISIEMRRLGTCTAVTIGLKSKFGANLHPARWIGSYGMSKEG